MGRPGNCPSTGHSSKNLHHRTRAPRFSSRIQRAQRRFADRIRYFRRRLCRLSTMVSSRPTIRTEIMLAIRAAMDYASRPRLRSERPLCHSLAIDDFVPQENTKTWTICRIGFQHKVAIAAILAVAALGLAPRKAYSAPILDVSPNGNPPLVQVGEYDSSHPGQEQKITYTFANVSQPDSQDADTMIEALISSMYDMGIYKVEVSGNMDDFNSNYLADNTQITLDNGTLYSYPGFNVGTVSIFSEFLQTGTGQITAKARGPPDNGPFEDADNSGQEYIEVPVPIPEPLTATMLALGGAGLLYKRRD